MEAVVAGDLAPLGRFDADIDVVGPPPLAAACADLAARYARAAGTTKPGAGPTS